MHEASNAGKINRQDATHWKGWQMRYKAMFAVGFVVGFILGARAGRERYEQLVKYGHQIAENPTVQKATSTVTAKTSELTKTAAAKAPDFAKTAVTSAKQLTVDKLPSRFGGKAGTADGAEQAAEAAEAAEAAAEDQLGYPADGQASVNGAPYTTG